MNEYISREEAIKELREVYEKEYPTASGDFDEYASHDVPNVLRNIPSADVQPVHHGKWEDEHYDDLLECFIATCPECGYESTDKYKISDNHRCCEYCGAKMDLKDGDAECSKLEEINTVSKLVPQPCTLCGNNCQVSLLEQFKVRNGLCKEREQMYREKKDGDTNE